MVDEARTASSIDTPEVANRPPECHVHGERATGQRLTVGEPGGPAAHADGCRTELKVHVAGTGGGDGIGDERDAPGPAASKASLAVASCRWIPSLISSQTTSARVRAAPTSPGSR